MVKGTQVSIEFDLNEYSILAALLFDCKNFCGDRGHLWHFLRLTSPEMEIRLQIFYGKAPADERSAGDNRPCHPESRRVFANLRSTNSLTRLEVWINSK
jgi:hypothetical protein